MFYRVLVVASSMRFFSRSLGRESDLLCTVPPKYVISWGVGPEKGGAQKSPSVEPNVPFYPGIHSNVMECWLRKPTLKRGVRESHLVLVMVTQVYKRSVQISWSVGSESLARKTLRVLFVLKGSGSLRKPF